jgi:hypothetical protein
LSRASSIVRSSVSNFFFNMFKPTLNTSSFIPKELRGGDMYRFGQRPKVRGVAMNPVDHPHGGRTKSIRLPKTPWGKVTKLK